MSSSIQGLCTSGALLLMSISGCSGANPRTFAKLNDGAALRGELPTNPLNWKVVTLMVDQANSTMSTLYGNDVAVGYARTNSADHNPAGSELALVTWKQREDPRWFGAKIPASVQSVEFVTVEQAGNGRSAYGYKKFEGGPLREISEPTSMEKDGRILFITSQRPAVLP